jgi:hypothetical protein
MDRHPMEHTASAYEGISSKDTASGQYFVEPSRIPTQVDGLTHAMHTEQEASKSVQNCIFGEGDTDK